METRLCRLSHHARGVVSCGVFLVGFFVWLAGLLLVCRTYHPGFA
jgi:hypothetical protein